ncbi:Erythrocyte band 7 integral membrane protein [Clonorchis sinensis]|uniref:Erythrocyte band 7 integral membrane protein n=2 Tax=Clonorchis sinensis TaxID=79923 RepID=H2KTM5_CLOSI|nr:Erythrocyte band 7 integral membrane protein [Clonorchis sinensis]GAA36238.1 erythrocyte band 7 integral membrane protein [Clonorchis sinensis]
MSAVQLEAGLADSREPNKVRQRKHRQSASDVRDVQQNSFPAVTEQADLEPEGHGCCGYFVIVLAALLCLCTFPFTVWFSFAIIQSYEKGIMLRLGKLRKQNGSAILSSGIRFKLPCVDQMIKVDMRTVTVNIPPQDILTKDSVTVAVDALVYMHVVDPASAILRVENWQMSTQLLAVSILRTVLGTYDLAELLTRRSEIDSQLRSELDRGTDPWGIKVERVEIKDVSLPQDMQRAMAAEAQAARAASAKVIAAKGELDASEMLREAALKMSATPVALHLRYLQTLATIATEQNSTIVFPLAMEWLDSFRPKH